MTPEEEESVRRALASLPPAGPVPPDVAARLDATLAGLVADRAAATDAGPNAGPNAGPGAGHDADDRGDRGDRGGHPGISGADRSGIPSLPEAGGTAPGSEPVSLDRARRRRRRWTGALVAAAAVAVVAGGVGTVVRGLSSGSDQAASAGSAAMDQEGADESLKGAGGGQAGPLVALAPRPVPLRSGDLAAGAAEVVGQARTGLLADVTGLAPRTTDRLTGQEAAAARTSRLLADCELPDIGVGDLVAPATLDGARATLVVRAVDSGTPEAQVYACDDGSQELATAPLPPR